MEKVGECGEWSQVQIDGAIYYVASQYLVTEDELPSGYVIVIDAGHQKQGNSEKEPIGPVSTQNRRGICRACLYNI